MRNPYRKGKGKRLKNRELSDFVINEKGEIYKKVGPRFHKVTTWRIMHFM